MNRADITTNADGSGFEIVILDGNMVVDRIEVVKISMDLVIED